MNWSIVSRVPHESRRRIALECVLYGSEGTGAIGHLGDVLWTRSSGYVDGELG